MSINANANGLAEGAYSDSISFSNVTNGRPGRLLRTIHLTVISPNRRELTVSPGTPAAFLGPNGGPFAPESQSYTLSNTPGGATLTWTASNTAYFMEYTLGHGTRWRPGCPNTSVSVSINGNANSLTASNYVDTLSFINFNNDVGDTTRSVTLTVTNVFPSIVANGSTLVSEGCTPTNGVIDPAKDWSRSALR